MSTHTFYNEDCIRGAARLADGSVDLIITDPPYGIRGDTLHRHYHRKEQFVIDGYVEVPAGEYAEFSRAWIAQAARVLRPGGSIYICSGYTNLRDILNALAATDLEEINHIVWKYNFGVYTRQKYISSHYHILFYVKPGGPRTFNTYCRYGAQSRGEDGRRENYVDREDVWIINREYKPGKRKNKNELPTELLKKMILYSSNPGDLVCDLFLGSFSTARVAIGLGRRATGFELSREAFSHRLSEVERTVPGYMLADLPAPVDDLPSNQNKKWAAGEKERLVERYREALDAEGTKKAALAVVAEEFGRGYFSVLNVVDAAGAGVRRGRGKEE